MTRIEQLTRSLVEQLNDLHPDHFPPLPMSVRWTLDELDEMLTQLHLDRVAAEAPLTHPAPLGDL